MLRKTLSVFFKNVSISSTDDVPPVPTLDKKFASSPSADAADTYWANLLKGVQHDPSLLPGGSRKVSKTETLSVISDEAVVQRLLDVERRTGLERFSIFQAAWAVNLSQHQSREDIIFAITVHTSSGVKLTFPQRIQASAGTNLFGVLKGLQRTQALGKKYGHVGFKRATQKSGSDSLRVQSILALVADDTPSEENFPMSFLIDVTDKICITASYDAGFSPAKMQVITRHFLKAIEAILRSDASTTVADVELVDSAERDFLIETGTAALPPHERLIHQLFEEQVERAPHKVAVEEETGDSLTYEELNAAANRLAHRIPCGPGHVVPICTDRSISLVMGVLAILKTGAAYVILDPEYPLERLSFITEDVQAPFVLTVSQYADYFSNPLLAFEDFAEDDFDEEELENPNIRMSAHDPAYVIYTSGSTGRPKGVILEHRAVASGLLYQPHPKDMRALMFYNPVFAAAQRSIFATITRGGCLCLASKESLTRNLSETIVKMNVNTVGLTSSTTTLLSSDAAKSLKRITLTGEKITQSVVEAWSAKVDLQCGYALSECTQMNWATKLVPGCNPTKIGRPRDTTSSYVLLPGSTRLAPLLVPGEICLAGPQVARSYLNRPEQTSKSFIENPFGEGKMYRTGDMAICLEDGCIEIIGRIDMQVKIAGQRLEPVEVTAVIREHSAVESATVVAIKLKGETSLVACIVLSPTAGPWTRKLQQSLKDHVLSVMPSFAVPSFWYILDKLPTNTNGKVDVPGLRHKLEKLGREGLLRLSARLFRSAEGGEARDEFTPSEKIVRKIWAGVLDLDIELIDSSSSFLELGGSSIRAIQVSTECRDAGLDVSVSDILRSKSLKDLAASIGQLDSNVHETYESFSLMDMSISSESVPLRDYDDVYPVSPLQEALVAASISGNPDYLYQKTYKVDGIDVKRLKTSFEDVLLKNDILRTTFLPYGSGFVQAVLKSNILQWEESFDSLEDYLLYDARRSVTLGEPFMRVAVLPEQSLLVLTTHHSLFDHWSNTFALDDVATVYQRRSLAPRTPYHAFIRHFLTIDPESSHKFWKGYLQDASPCVLSDSPKLQRHVIEKDMNINAKDFLSTNSLTAGSLVYAAWGLVLSQQTVSNEVVFGTTLSGRDVPVSNVHSMGGPTLATVPQRIVIDPKQTVADYVRSVQDGLWEMNRYAHSGIRGALQASGHPSSLFDTMVNLLAPQDTPTRTKDVFRPFGAPPVWNTEYATLEAIVSEKHFFFRLNSELDADRAKFIVEQFGIALMNMVAKPKAKMSDIQLVGKVEMDFLSKFSLPVDETLTGFMQSAFEKVAAESPDSIAIHWEGPKTELVAYGDLNSRANRLAMLLQDEGVRPETVVPLCIDKSISMVVAILGVLKSGGAYTPLDPENPPERNNFIASDVEAEFVLTERAHADMFADTGLKVICIEDLDLSGSWPNPTSAVKPDNLAYVLYTSGSTGLPKGALILHGSVAAVMSSLTEAEGCHPGSRILQFSNYVFDASVSDMFTAFGSGATVCLAPVPSLLADLAGCITTMRVNHAFLTPTVAKLLRPEDVPTLEKLILGGEALTQDLVSTWASKLTLMNGYGPTEGTVWSTLTLVPQGGNHRNIGALLRTISGVILQDGNLELTPYGAIGELCIGGPQLARGYLKRPDLNEKVFVQYKGKRLYRTGDLVRWLPNGDLECFGRKDSQVKISGHRIELGEIEQAILTAEKATACIVNVVKLQGKPQLAAFVLFGESQDNQKDIFLPAGTHADLIMSTSIGLSTLPPYMVPKIWIPVSHFPLMPSGKANVKKLGQMVESLDPLEVAKYTSSGAEEAGEFVSPETTEEMLLQDLWASVLSINKDDISANASFFSFGGDSISAISLVSRVRRAEYNLSVGDVLAFPVLRDMASRLKLAQGAEEAIEEMPAMEVDDDVYNQLWLHGVSREDIETILPCGPGQSEFRLRADCEEQFWQLHTVRPIPADFDVHRWTEVLVSLTERNPVLRTMYVRTKGQGSTAFLQVVLNKPVVDFATIDVQDDADMERVVERDWQQPFSVGQPFMRYRLLLLVDGRRFLMVKADHGSYDGTLLQIFNAQFKAMARGEPVEEPASFHSFVGHIQRSDKAKTLRFWRGLLQGNEFSYPQTAASSAISGMSVLKLDRRIDAFASQCGVTVPIVLQTAFTVLLARMSKQTDVSYDNLVTGRDVDMPLETQLINGCCANFIPFRSSFHARTTVRELLRDTQKLFWETTEHGTVSLSEIYSELGVVRSERANKCMFIFQPFEPPSGPVDHMRWVAMGLSKVRQPVDYALMLEVAKNAVGYSPRLQYDSKVFKPADVEELGERFLGIVEGMMAQSRAPVHELLL